MARTRRRTGKVRAMRGRGQVTPINVLNDDVLLAIFDFCVANDRTRPQMWQSLVHVCQRWRTLVFESPRRLNLRLCCTPKTPAKDKLDIWPALPLIVRVDTTESGTDNIIAALGQSDRVCQVIVDVSGWHPEEVLAPMQVPFPELTYLRLHAYQTPRVIPDSFLGGSAPRLQNLHLLGIPFPGLPKLLLSATHLVSLVLWYTPHSGYISPEAMVAPLSVLSSLDKLILGFKSPESRPDLESRSLPQLKRSILPALHEFAFQGVTEYLEDLVTFIDAPQLNKFYIRFFSQVDFDTPRLVQFINRTPTLRERDEAHVQFAHTTASVKVLAGSGTLKINLSIPCGSPDRQLQSIEQNDAIENTLWLELLLPFTGVKNLYLSEEFAPHVATALQELVGDRITEVLPSLQNIVIEGLEPSGPFQENIGQFVAARRLSCHPIVISAWDNSPKMKPM